MGVHAAEPRTLGEGARLTSSSTSTDHPPCRRSGCKARIDFTTDRPARSCRKAKKDPLTDAEEETVREWLAIPGRQIEWKGLIFCEPLAAEFPYVVDHYLHGGAERLRSAVDSLAGLVVGSMKAREASAAGPGDGPTALLEPSEIIGHLTTLDAVLDTDPHYTYEHTVGPTLPEIQPDPNLFAAAQRGLPNGRWMTFKIYQRSRQIAGRAADPDQA